jgi:hypothetical protein
LLDIGEIDQVTFDNTKQKLLDDYLS